MWKSWRVHAGEIYSPKRMYSACETPAVWRCVWCKPQHEYLLNVAARPRCSNAALHSELFLTPWQTSHYHPRREKLSEIPWIFSEKFDIGPKPIPWLWEYVKHVPFLFFSSFTYSWLEHQLVASSQDCKAFAFTCRLTALLNCFGIYSAL